MKKVIKVYGNAKELKGLDLRAVCNKAVEDDATIILIGASRTAFGNLIYEARKASGNKNLYDDVKFGAAVGRNNKGRTRKEVMDEAESWIDDYASRHGWTTVDTIDLRGFKAPKEETNFFEAAPRYRAETNKAETYETLKNLDKDAEIKFDTDKLKAAGYKADKWGYYKVKNWKISKNGRTSYFNFNGCFALKTVLAGRDGVDRDRALKQLAYVLNLCK